MKKFITVSAALVLSDVGLSQSKQSALKDVLYTGFFTPSNAAKPRVWWHRMNGNIIKDCIRKDLDMSEVKNLAEVTVNGKNLGVVWEKPFRVNVTNALNSGENKPEVKVISLWVNRLIGDAQPGITNKITYTAMPFYQANSPLLSSILPGPVKLISSSH